MSDFLSKFSEENKEKQPPKPSFLDSTIQNENDVSEKLPTEKTVTPKPVPIAPTKAITAPEHTMREDTTFHKRKMMKYYIAGGTTLAVAVLIFMLIRMLNTVQIRDFSGDTIDAVRLWGVTNDISIETQTEYSLQYGENVVFGQSREPGSRLMSGAVLTVTVSLGPDMTEVIQLPDFEAMTTAQVRNWRLDNQVLSVNVREEYSETVPSGQFIRLDVPTATDIETFRRSDTLDIYMSRGLRTVQVPNFSSGNTMREAVETWASENDINIEFEYEPDEDVASDMVLRQSIAPGSRMTVEDTLVITVSGGVGVIVPDFNTLTHEEAMSVTGLFITTRHRFHATIPYGRVITQSPAAGTEIFGDDAEVTITYSLGRPWIDDLRGQTYNNLGPIMFAFTSQGANITYTVTSVSSSQPRGTIVSMSHFAQHLDMNTHITFHVSLGDLSEPNWDE